MSFNPLLVVTSFGFSLKYDKGMTTMRVGVIGAPGVCSR
jgi:hypothetical protein